MKYVIQNEICGVWDKAIYYWIDLRSDETFVQFWEAVFRLLNIT